MRWPVLESPSLPAAVRARFAARFARRISAGGELLLSSQRYRDQGRNVADCLEKLDAMLAEVVKPPTPRRPTRHTRASVERRLAQKHRRSESKHRRRPPRDDRD